MMFKTSSSQVSKQSKALFSLANRAFGSGAIAEFDTKLHADSKGRRIAPAAYGYLRGFRVLPSEVTATGPKGFLTKGDILAHIAAQGLQRQIIDPHDAAVPATQAPAPVAAAPVKKAPKKKAAPSAASPVFDANNPFQQTWKDATMTPEIYDVAQNIGSSKRLLGHAYITSKVNVSAIKEGFFAEVPFESFVLKAAQKAFKNAVNDLELDISRVHGHDSKSLYVHVDDLRVGQLVDAAQSTTSYPTSSQFITVHQTANSVESLPICEDPAILSIHYTLPQTEVIAGDLLFFDISNDADLDSLEAQEQEVFDASQITTAQTSRISVAYDVLKVDDQTAAEFMHQFKRYMDDPDLLLL